MHGCNALMQSIERANVSCIVLRYWFFCSQ